MKPNFQNVLESPLFIKTYVKFLGTKNFELITRPSCFVVRSKNEDSRLVRRVILLPPSGFTADKIELLNPHPEARKARIKILGKINPDKKGFKPLIREVRLNFSLLRNMPTEKTSAYAKFSKKYCGSKLLSWKNWVYVVKENGWGNFHNLINLSDEWVVALLEKWLIDQKTINILPYLKRIPKQTKKLQETLGKITLLGDAIFKNEKLIRVVLKFPYEITVPVFIQMLNVQETGKHEPCTFFALLLKIAKKNRALVRQETKKAITHESAPHYYLHDLERKLVK